MYQRVIWLNAVIRRYLPLTTIITTKVFLISSSLSKHIELGYFPKGSNAKVNVYWTWDIVSKLSFFINECFGLNEPYPNFQLNASQKIATKKREFSGFFSLFLLKFILSPTVTQTHTHIFSVLIAVLSAVHVNWH